MNLCRFGFGILLACLLCGTLACAPFTPLAPTPTLSPTALMTHGPLTGAVTFDSAQVWLRTNERADVKIEYLIAADARASQLSDVVTSQAESDFTVHVPLSKLAPATLYNVYVWVNGRKQAQGGRFKTFPGESYAAPFRLVVLTDFAYAAALPVKTFENAAAENPDLVFIGGDFDHRDPKLLPDHRQMFRDLYADDPQSPVAEFTRYFLHQFPLAHQWDDHDYGGDNSDRTAVWRETALRVFGEYFPSYPLGKYGIYQSIHYGKDVELFVLDNRSQRDPNKMPDDSEEKSMLDGEHHADGQLQWLLDGLKNSTATWKLIMSSVPLNATMLKGDSWANFTHERDRILQFIRDNKIGGVMVIAGDLHGGALDNGRNAGVPSAVIPSANLTTCFSVPVQKLGEWSNGIYGSATHADNHVPCPGYGVVNIQGAQAHIEIRDDTGKTQLQMDVTPDESYAIP